MKATMTEGPPAKSPVKPLSITGREGRGRKEEGVRLEAGPGDQIGAAAVTT